MFGSDQIQAFCLNPVRSRSVLLGSGQIQVFSAWIRSDPGFLLGSGQIQAFFAWFRSEAGLFCLNPVRSCAFLLGSGQYRPCLLDPDKQDGTHAILYLYFSESSKEKRRCHAHFSEGHRSIFYVCLPVYGYISTVNKYFIFEIVVFIQDLFMFRYICSLFILKSCAKRSHFNSLLMIPKDGSINKYTLHSIRF